jgi:two-component system, chemotaxis family, chemotaxis protein CheY
MKPTLIIVDDVEETREELRAGLEADFEIVATATNGHEGAELALKLRPDLMLIDVVMPILSGIGATRVILEASPPHPKIIMLSGVTREATMLEARAAGAFDYLFKPFQIKRVKEVLLDALTRS